MKCQNFIKTEAQVDSQGKTPSNKTPALAKSINMGIWVVGASNQLFIKGS